MGKCIIYNVCLSQQMHAVTLICHVLSDVINRVKKMNQKFFFFIFWLSSLYCPLHRTPYISRHKGFQTQTHSWSRQTTKTTLSTLSRETYNTTLSSNTLGSRDTSGTLHIRK